MAVTNEEAMLKDIYEHERQKAIIEKKCKQAIKLGLSTKAFAEDILKVMGVEV